MSNLEKLRTVQSNLSNIRIPAAFTESITIPMFNAILALDQVCQEMEKAEVDSQTIEQIKMETDSAEAGDA